MKTRHFIYCGLLAIGALPSAINAQATDVAPPQRREPVVNDAARLAATPERPALPEQLKNPFAPAVAPTTSVAGPAAPGVSSTPDRELLQRLAPLVDPTGTMHLGGQPILLFGQKKVTEGDALPVTFNGQPYVLIISHIDSTSFTLRLNGEETTRPIKPANRP